MSGEYPAEASGEIERFLEAVELVEFARQWIQRNDALAIEAVHQRDKLDAALRDYQSRRRWLVQYTDSVRGEAGLTDEGDIEERFLQDVIDGLLRDALG